MAASDHHGGVNDELAPWLRMVGPPSLRNATLDDLPPDESTRFWLLLGGVLPVECDILRLEAMEAPRWFRERSRMLLLAEWVHERHIIAVDGNSTRVEYQLSWRARRPLDRLAPAVALQRLVVGGLFSHRHRRLAAHFGTGRSQL